MIVFEPFSWDRFSDFRDIINSNPYYNLLSEGHEALSDEEIRQWYTDSKTQGSILCFITNNHRVVGIIDYLMENPSDHMPWLGLLMIRGQDQGHGLATAALHHYEELMRKSGERQVRLGVIKGNDRALAFWTSRGFRFYQEKEGSQWTVLCLEKDL